MSNTGSSAYRVGTVADQAAAVVAYAVVGMGSGVAWLVLFGYLRSKPELSDPISRGDFFRLSEPMFTLLGYGVSALIGWFVNPAIALAIFVIFPVIYVIRVRGAEH